MTTQQTQPRRGDWIQTFTVRQFWPLDPRADEVFVEDVAHALAMQCRFAGHVSRFYSVAEHSVRVSWCAEQLATPERKVLAARWGLLHDASEAYLVDLPRPVKRSPELRAYRDAERVVMQAVAERFALPGGEPDEVIRADGILLNTEARDLLPGRHPAGAEQWSRSAWNMDPLPERIEPWDPARAESEFLARYRGLFGV